MFLDKYGRSWQGPFSFTPEAVGIAADAARRFGIRSGLYQILYMKQPVYIGVSSASIFDRLAKHVKGRGNRLVGRRTEPEVYEFIYWLRDEKTARQIESHTTVEDKPGFNQKIEYINYIANITVH